MQSGMTSDIFNAAGALKLPTVAQSTPFYFALIFFMEDRHCFSSACICVCFLKS